MVRSAVKCRSLTYSDIFHPSSEYINENRVDYFIIQDMLSFGRNTEFYFGNLNVLIGPNGSGKSNLIDCLKVMQSLPFDISRNFKNTQLEDWIYKGDDQSIRLPQLSISVSIKNIGKVEHQISFINSQYNKIFIEEVILDNEGELEIPYFINNSESRPKIAYFDQRRNRREREFSGTFNSSQSVLNQVRDTEQYPELSSLARFYSSMQFYSEWTFGRRSSLRNSSSINNPEDFLNESMDNLPLVLNSLRETESHDLIRKYLNDLKESYRDYFTTVRFGQVVLEIIESGLMSRIPAQRLSDGTLRFLALATILLNKNLPSVICLEEPELGMHPDMIRMISRMIIEASKKSQIFVTTHSELLLTSLQGDLDQLFVFTSGPDGSSVRSFERDDFSEWLTKNQLGDLWSNGELGGNRW